MLQNAMANMVAQRTHELQERSEQLEQALEKVQEADRLKTEFISTVSHELKSPLATVTALVAIAAPPGVNCPTPAQLARPKHKKIIAIFFINEIVTRNRREKGLS